MSSVGVRLVTRLVFAAAQGATLQGILLVPLILGTFAFLQFINGSMAQHAENLPWETACDADVRPRLGTFDTLTCVAACLGVAVVITRWVLPIAGWTVEDRDVRRAKRISLDVVGGTLSPSRNHGGGLTCRVHVMSVAGARIPHGVLAGRLVPRGCHRRDAEENQLQAEAS